MVESTDWRWNGQERFLYGVRFRPERYAATSPHWDHEHCEMCGDKISEYEGDTNDAYCSADKRHWVCPRCFADFAVVLKWTAPDV